MKPIKVDLHGHKHENVRNVVIRAIENHYLESEAVLDFISGHSPDMKSIVIEIINEYGLEFRIGDFSGVNQGFIRVYMY